MPLVTLLILVVGRLLLDISSTISSGTGYRLYGAIFFLARSISFTSLSMEIVLRRAKTARFLTIPNITGTFAFLLRMRSIIVWSISTF